MARTFCDARNREWRISATVETLTRIQQATGENLPTLFGGRWEGAIAIADDPVRVGKILVAWLDDDLRRANVTAKDFLDSLYGDAIEEATESLLEAVIDFFPSRRRDLYRSAMRRGMESVKTEMDKMLQAIETPKDFPAMTPDTSSENVGS